MIAGLESRPPTVPRPNGWGRQRWDPAATRTSTSMLSVWRGSSRAARLRRIAPQRVHRCTNIQPRRASCSTATHSIVPPHRDARSPGTSSTCFDHKHSGQWFRQEPLARSSTRAPQCSHTNPSFRTQRKRLLSPATANLLECGLMPHQGIGFGMLLPPKSDSGGRRALPQQDPIHRRCFGLGGYFQFQLHDGLLHPPIRTTTGFERLCPGHCEAASRAQPATSHR